MYHLEVLGTAYKWNDEDNLNKRNFLELVKFTAKRNATLHTNIKTAIKNSKGRKRNSLILAVGTVVT